MSGSECLQPALKHWRHTGMKAKLLRTVNTAKGSFTKKPVGSFLNKSGLLFPTWWNCLQHRELYSSLLKGSPFCPIQPSFWRCKTLGRPSWANLGNSLRLMFLIKDQSLTWSDIHMSCFKTCFVFYRKAEVHKTEFSPNSTSQTVMCVFVHYL